MSAHSHIRHAGAGVRPFAGIATLVFVPAALVLLLSAAPGMGEAAPQVVAFRQTSPSGLTGLMARLRPFDPPVFGPDVQANEDPGNYSQHEPGLAVSRTNNNVVVAAAKDYRQSNVKRVWIYASTDGGLTWPVQLHMPDLPPTETESDPVVMARDDGRIYVSCLTTGNNGVFITWTDDNGQTWHPSVPIVQNQPSLQDKDWFAIDNNPASPFYHRMYMMYAPGASYVVEQHSTDGGLTWSARQQIGASNTEYTYPVVASDGTVYNFMMFNWGSGRVGTIQVTRSTDGGVTWSNPVAVALAYQPSSPIRGGDLFRFFAILSAAVDPNTGHLYVAWTDSRNFSTTGTDVLYVKSTDGGATWSNPPMRLSNTQECPLCDNITPMITVGADSRLHAFWLDRSFDPNHYLFDSWYTSSTDGGATWHAPIRVSSQSQDLNVGLPCCAGNYPAGDYWGLDTAGDAVYVAWNDSRTGDQDIMVARGQLPVGSTPTATATATATATGTRTPAPSATPSPSPTLNPSPSPSPTTCPPGDYVYATATATIVAGTTDTGNHCDDCTTSITLPFPVALYDRTYSQVGLDSNGRAIFGSTTVWRECLPATGNTFTIYPYWDDLLTNCAGCGIYTSVTGVAPDRIFNIEWRTTYAANPGQQANFELRLYEGQGRFEVVYGTTEHGNSTAISGVQRDATFYTQYFCWGSGGQAQGSVSYTYQSTCPTPSPSPSPPPPSSPSPSPSPTLTGTPVSTGTPSPTPTACTIQFVDVPPSHAFYPYVRCLACRGIVGGYSDGTFRPDNPATRGQLSKIVANAAGILDPIPPDRQTYTDVPPSHPFWVYIERLTAHHIVGGYNDPAMCPTGVPCFRPDDWITRGQMTKFASNAAGFSEPIPPGRQSFTDVPSTHPFWVYIERLSGRGIISGYQCGVPPAGPCDPQNRPYYLPDNMLTRGQTSKIVANTFNPGCAP